MIRSQLNNENCCFFSRRDKPTPIVRFLIFVHHPETSIKFPVSSIRSPQAIGSLRHQIVGSITNPATAPLPDTGMSPQDSSLGSLFFHRFPNILQAL